MPRKIQVSTVVVVGIVSLVVASAMGENYRNKKAFFKPGFLRRDSVPGSDSAKQDTLRFPIYDHYGDALGHPQPGTIDLQDPPVIKKTVVYDSATHRYDIQQNIGNYYYRNPTWLSYQDYLKLQSQQDENAYWMQRANTMSLLNRITGGPTLYQGPQLYNRVFGGTQADIRPQGELDLTFGYQGQDYGNLTLPEQARKTGGFDFNMNVNMNVDAQIGRKLRITSSYNSQAVFNYQKQIKLEYTGDNDEIIRKIEAGNVSFPLHSQLITGMQSLFGIKTQLQFGRLSVTSVLASQQSQQQNLIIQGGAQSQQFAIQADQYEDNRHFLLSQYFHDNYDYFLSDLPVIKSQVYITRMEVWVTNKTGATTNVRNIVGLMDLGESKPYNNNIQSLTSNPLPQNGANSEYSQVISNPASRNTSTVINTLESLGLQPVQDFEKTFARKLDSTQYSYDPQLGYINLNQQLQPDQVLAVAFQYTYNGRVFQVGEFSESVPPDSTQAQPQVLFLKLLKSTSARTELPIWQLMMKNIYSTGGYQLQKQDFRMDIFYQDPGAGEKRYLPDGPNAGVPLLTLLNLDRLNSNNDPQPDGVFDYVEGYTINSRNGTIIFPVLEPFGKDLAKAFNGDPALIAKYVYQPLYDSTKTIAQQFPQLDRYIMRGTYKSSYSSDISLGAFNIPPGSVTVTAGGQRLVENVDYTVDYNLGRLKILNTGILNSGLPINVQFENNASFGQQTRNYLGTRLDYYLSDKLTLGSTIVRMSERPYYSQVNYGEDPIKNTIAGFDANYRSELPGVTRWLDKLPNYATTTPSTITATGEVARLIPGHSSLIGKGSQGAVYIDNFEGSQNNYDLKFPYNAWALASTPKGATGPGGNTLFPEADLNDSLAYNKNRALLAWYTIEPSLVDGSAGTPDYIRANKALRLDHYVRQVFQKDVFPNRSVDLGQGILTTLDLAYYPSEKGPYNLDATPSDIDANGSLLNPQSRWGGIMRALDNTDFEQTNVEYIEFWVMDPFIDNPGSSGGQLYVDLGDVSEDILKDGKMFFENGLPYPPNSAMLDSSKWGYVPKLQQQITNAFDNDPAARRYQDVGYDGLSDDQERVFRAGYLAQLAANFGAGSTVYQEAYNDPDNDDYHFYRGADYDAAKLPVLARYKRFNGSEGDSPLSNPNSPYSTAATNYPETEDINHDNTLNETESYFQYMVQMQPNMQVGTNFIVDEITVPADAQNGPLEPERWYQFKIPIQSYNARVGDIPDFKSIRFMRMFLTGFKDSVVLRFGDLNLVRNQWRNYLFSLKTPGQYTPVDNSNFAVSAVNVEENSSRTPIPYLIPPGIARQTDLSANNVVLQQNEQSMSLKVNGLQEGDSRSVFKELDMDFRQYKRLQLFIHAEALPGQDNSLPDGSLQAIIRLGSDFVSNYYEYRIPLHITRQNGQYTPYTVWPTANSVDLLLSELPALKEDRNRNGVSPTIPYTEKDAAGNYITVVGNPSLGNVVDALLGVLNPQKQDGGIGDGLPRSAELWFDEMRLTDINEQGGYAATGRVDMQLADLGTASLAGSMHTAGFGSVDQRVNDRFKDNLTQFDAATNLQLGKLLPKRMGLSIPMYAGYSQAVSNPQYDPYNTDIKLKDELRLARSAAERDSIKQQAQNFTSIKSVNFTNVRKLLSPDKTTRHLWDIENFDISYSFNQTLTHSPLIANDVLTQNRFGFGYNFAGKSKFLTPFQKMIKSRSKWWGLIKEFNFNYVPSAIGFRSDINRQFESTDIRNIGGGPYKIPTNFNKYFTFNRFYTLTWDFTRNLRLDFNAVNNAVVDEPYGRLNTPAKVDTVFNHLLSLGRTTLYHQTANINYTLPTNKFPLLDWTTMKVGYSTDYSWTAASRLAVYLGNGLQNSNQKQVGAEFNFNTLYNKSKFLRLINNEGRSGRSASASPKGNNSQAGAAGKEEKNTATEISPVLKVLLRPLLSLKTIRINYNETSSTNLPGYLDSTKFLGQGWSPVMPGLKFGFGWQPDKAWLDKIANGGWLTRDSTFNLQYQQNFTQKIDAQASLEPFNGLRLDLNLTKSFSKTHSELFKDTSGGTGFSHLNPYDAGGFNVSIIALRTLFGKINMQSGISQTFLDFQNYRQIISNRIGNTNPYTGGKPDPTDPGYMLGYGRYAQDVLVPAFLAAYLGESPYKIGLLKEGNDNVRSNPFSNLVPEPNWSLSYNGLGRLPVFRDFISNMTITHAYTASLSMNSFTSSMLYQDPLSYGFPSFIDTVSGNYIPYFLIPNITVSEQLAPLIGVDVTFTNNINARVSFNKSRTLSLSLIDYQVSEMRSNEITVGGGFRIRGVTLPFQVSNKKVTNDLNFRMDVSYRDDKTVNNKLDANLVVPTSGQKVIGIRPSIDYVVNNRLRLHFFYDREQTVPVISTAYPITNTHGGVTLQFVLAQ